MIINLRGTSGSGKSTLMRQVMEQYGLQQPVFVPDRKRPLYYKLWRTHETPKPDLVVLGHYETACGGCDTIPTTDMLFDLISEAHFLLGATHVLYEGLLVSSDFKRTLELQQQVGEDNLLVIELATPLEECLASVNKRRAARDATLPGVNPKNTEAKWKGTRSSSQKLAEAGVHVATLSRDEAKTRLLEVLW